MLISEASPVGELYSPGGIVYKINKIKIISYNLEWKQQTYLSYEQIKYNEYYLSMLKSILRMPHFYFSYNYDISSTFQRSFQKQQSKETLIMRANMKFVWNGRLLSSLLMNQNQEIYYFCLPVICGFVSIHQDMINQRKFRWILLSRRCVNRCGTRWFARGINKEGWVANFVETEQILSTEQGDIFSLVQVRGSIPIFWSQLPNLAYKPSFVIPNAPHIESYGIHVRHLFEEYGRLCFVNLIGKTGSEGKLSKAFSDVVNEGNFNRGNDIPFVNLESFDFHHECKREGWDALNKLLDQISLFIDEYGYFYWSKQKNSNNQFQTGIIRTNCIDSLDRTNVVQSLIAKHVLTLQMIQCGIMKSFEKIQDYPELNFIFSNIWADNADVCSIQYAGTGALKSDFTRTGKRRMKGRIADGINSLIRYYKNNFEDGFRQDSFDLILGEYEVNEAEGKQIRCPLEKRNILKIAFLPLLFLFSVSMFLFTIIFDVTSHIEFRVEQALYSLFWIAMSSICFVIMYYLGNEFANYPTLVRRH